MSTDDLHRFHEEEPLNKLEAQDKVQSFELLQLLRDVATVLGLREASDVKTMRRLKEYVKAGMRREDHHK